MNEKIYYSQLNRPDDWNTDDIGILTFFWVPKKWWSIKAWKIMFEFRAEIQKKLLGKYIEVIACDQPHKP